MILVFFFFNDTATTEIYTLSLHDALPISEAGIASVAAMSVLDFKGAPVGRLGIGAAIGGYRSKQAVAVGMAFAPNENLNFTGKVGLSTDDIRNSAYGVGVNYFF